jgi:hypothetical protein
MKKYSELMALSPQHGAEARHPFMPQLCGMMGSLRAPDGECCVSHSRTWMVFPFLALTTSPGLLALPLGIFSQRGAKPMRKNTWRNMERARSNHAIYRIGGCWWANRRMPDIDATWTKWHNWDCVHQQQEAHTTFVAFSSKGLAWFWSRRTK